MIKIILKYRFTLIFAVLFFAVGCGKKGAPLPPLVRIPAKVGDLGWVQVGERVRLDFTLPAENVDGTKPAEIGSIILFRKIEGLDKETKGIKTITIGEGISILANDKLSIYDENIPKEIIKSGAEIKYYVVISSKKNRDAGLSNEAVVKIGKAIDKPIGLQHNVREDRIEIFWDYSKEKNLGIKFVVCKGNDRNDLLNYTCIDEAIEETRYEDPEVVEGKKVYYYVKAVDKERKRESEISDILEVEYWDTFAPQSPVGVVFFITEEGVVLNWNPVESDDLEGYKIYKRKLGSKDFVLITAKPLKMLTYKDKDVVDGDVYEYYITSVDDATPPNESKPSQVIVVKYSKK